MATPAPATERCCQEAGGALGQEAEREVIWHALPLGAVQRPRPHKGRETPATPWGHLDGKQHVISWCALESDKAHRSVESATSLQLI